MGIFDRLMGREESDDAPERKQGKSEQLTDEQALARYRYMLRTAPPETVEQAHEEAFAKLTPQQRRMTLEQLRTTLPERERAASDPAQDDAKTLSRMATRAELRQPGTMERIFGGGGGMGGGFGGIGGGVGFGGLMAGSLMSSIVGTFIGSAIAEQFFDNDTGSGLGFGEGDAGYQDTGGADFGQGGADAGNEIAGDTGGFDDIFGGSDFDGGGGDFE